MKTIFVLAVLLGGLTALPAPAQVPVAPAVSGDQAYSSEQLATLLGPIALYPDPLIAEMLPAATLPTQIVMADRYVASGGDPDQIDQQPWDASVKALARYPTVLKWMDDNLNWTTDLGQAFLSQQQEVMDSIQRLRASAQNYGNLPSTPQQQVVVDDGTIEILPTDPQVIYVPEYAPDTVYYESSFGAPFITFGLGFPIGFWLNCDFDWHHRNFVVWNRDHPRPNGWWRERPDDRAASFGRYTRSWQPDNRRGFIPGNRRGFTAGSRGDRGWGRPTLDSAPRNLSRPAGNPAAPAHDMPQQRPPAHNDMPQQRPPAHNDVPQQRPPAHNAPTINPPRQAPNPNPPRSAPAMDRHGPPANPPPPNGALIGVQSARETRTVSERGRQSMQRVPPSAPASHPAPAPSNGGGRHDSDPKAKR